MKLKVCGLSTDADVKTCIANNVNYCGFILNFPKSHRYISFSKAYELTSIDKKNSEYVGVLVDPTEQEMRKFSSLNLDYFQLYGEYTDKEIKNIKHKFNKKVITSIQVKKREDIDNYFRVKNESDIILWDSSGYEKSLKWNYEWIRGISINCKKMIAGNIVINDLKKLIGLADIIDVSGSLETNKVKDKVKIKSFVDEMNKIKNAN